MRLTLDGAFAVGRIPLPLDGTFAVGFAFWLLDLKFVFELVRATRPFVRIEEKTHSYFLTTYRMSPARSTQTFPSQTWSEMGSSCFKTILPQIMRNADATRLLGEWSICSWAGAFAVGWCVCRWASAFAVGWCVCRWVVLLPLDHKSVIQTYIYTYILRYKSISTY